MNNSSASGDNGSAWRVVRTFQQVRIPLDDEQRALHSGPTQVSRYTMGYMMHSIRLACLLLALPLLALAAERQASAALGATDLDAEVAGVVPAMSEVPAAESILLMDAVRQREIPLALYRPKAGRCPPAKRCPVVLLSPGYGLAHTDYAFLAERLAASGYLVVAIRHDLPNDPPQGQSGNLIADRSPMWQRGAENLRFVRKTVPMRYPEYDWSRPILIGHSNGGDLSALALHETPSLAGTLVTLDNRRYPLPRSPAIRVLSVRGADFEADPGVLPGPDEPTPMCVGRIAKARHNDMNDHGPEWLKAEINRRVLDFLQEGTCDR